MKEKNKACLGIFLVFFFFILLSYLLQTNIDFFKDKLDFGFFGIMIYFLLGYFATLFGPVTMVPFIPIGVALWGWQLTFVLNLIS